MTNNFEIKYSDWSIYIHLVQNMLFKKLTVGYSLMLSLLLVSAQAYAHNASSNPEQRYNFNTPEYHLTDNISMSFLTASHFTVIQWNLKAGAKLLPIHSHLNEQVTRVLSGDVEVRIGNSTYIIHAGEIIVFPPYAPHGFVALKDAVIYEQQPTSPRFF